MVEDILIPPPVDAIPDEYEFSEENRRIHVHIFSTENTLAEKNVNKFKETLNTKDYSLHEYNLKKVSFEDSLEKSE